MSNYRPLTKTTAKKLCLKIFLEIEGNSSYLRGESSYYRHVALSHMPAFFNMGDLTLDEQKVALQAVMELQRDGYIVQHPNNQSEFRFCLTNEGRAIARQRLDEMQIASVNLSELISRKELITKVADDFYSGEFESAVMKAFKMVEEAVRVKGGFTANDYGRDMFDRAFSEKNAVLKHPEALASGEQKALMFLMSGAYGWFRNPAGHRTVTYANGKQAAQILAFANLLLDLIDKCTV